MHDGPEPRLASTPVKLTVVLPDVSSDHLPDAYDDVLHVWTAKPDHCSIRIESSPYWHRSVPHRDLAGQESCQVGLSLTRFESSVVLGAVWVDSIRLKLSRQKQNAA